jgi:acylphosphatase
VLISGRVQGVWYRGWTQERALGLGLDGWVRNRRDGGVEAVFSGPGEAVAEMIRACADGPPAAAVREVKIVDEGGGVAAGFELRPTV